MNVPSIAPLPAPANGRDALSVLHSVFGLPGFRGAQGEIIRHVTDGGNCLVLMPTGGGKSLCYQLPSLLREGCGIVVSPLIALMRDQVAGLLEAGVNAAALNSSLTPQEASDIERRLIAGDLDLLYVAPERLVTPRCLSMLAQAKVALFAIDEAHCVSQWGHDFRPEYRALDCLADLFPDVPRLALLPGRVGRLVSACHGLLLVVASARIFRTVRRAGDDTRRRLNASARVRRNFGSIAIASRRLASASSRAPLFAITRASCARTIIDSGSSAWARRRLEIARAYSPVASSGSAAHW